MYSKYCESYCGDSELCYALAKSTDFVVVVVVLLDNLTCLQLKTLSGAATQISVLLLVAGLLAVCTVHLWCRVSRRFVSQSFLVAVVGLRARRIRDFCRSFSCPMYADCILLLS